MTINELKDTVSANFHAYTKEWINKETTIENLYEMIETAAEAENDELIPNFEEFCKYHRYLQNTLQNNHIQYGLSMVPFSLPSLQWYSDTGFVLESVTEQEIKNLQTWLGTKAETTDLEILLEEKIQEMNDPLSWNYISVTISHCPFAFEKVGTITENEMTVDFSGSVLVEIFKHKDTKRLFVRCFETDEVIECQDLPTAQKTATELAFDYLTV